MSTELIPEEAAKMPWQARLHEIIYESATPAGKAFDVSLLVLIVASISTVMLDSVPRWHQVYGDFFVKLGTPGNTCSVS